MRIDLHTHTSVSDGKLSPADLIGRASAKGIQLLSITDHDTVDAYRQIDLKAAAPRLIPGIEFSTYWNKTGIHIVGLNIDLNSSALHEGIRLQHEARGIRARAIAHKLEKHGIENALDAARAIAGNDNIGRPHFARHLVDLGVAKNIEDAFKKFLGAGKAGDIRKYWAPLPQIIDWIRTAGGVAVLAHPLKYKLSRSRLIALIDDFAEAGGQGMEVISGKQPAPAIRQLARICNQKELLASCGSDFHQPDQSWAELGEFQPLPKDCKPVWDAFR